jgi:hypothetical protein
MKNEVSAIKVEDEFVKSASLFRGDKKGWNLVYIPLIFKKRVVGFQPKVVRFLKEYGPGIGIEECATKAGMSLKEAMKWLRNHDVRDYLEDRACLGAIKAGWSGDRWVYEGDLVYNGEKEWTEDQKRVWLEFGDRVMPRVTKNQGERNNQPVININVASLTADLERQKEIEGSLKAELIEKSGEVV